MRKTLDTTEMDLLTYLRSCEPDELVHFSGSTYCTREHDSLKISNGKWYWFSRGFGGRSALDYLVKVKGYSFQQAVETVLKQVAIAPPVFVSRPTAAPDREKSKTLLLPAASPDHTAVLRYLTVQRGLDADIVQDCIRSGLIYESLPYHNAVFVGRNASGQARYASLRGTRSSFKGEATGSDKRYSFRLPAANSDTLHLFESAIDLLSYATLQKQAGKDWRTDHLLSLAGVYRPRQDVQQTTLPVALTQYLQDHPEVRRAVLRLDNDFTGQLAAQTLQVLLADRLEVTITPPPMGKDYNDCLCAGRAPPQKQRRTLDAAR